MPVFEMLIVPMTASIGKALLRVWLGDGPNVTVDIASDLVSTLRAWTSDTLAQQRGARQFEIMGEKVAEELLRMLDRTGRHLEEGDRAEVGNALIATLNATQWNAKILAQHGLDPVRLAQYLTKANPGATKLFSDAQTALYQRLISETSQYIIDIASQLPNFTERTLAEVLKREENLVAIANTLLSEVRRIREESQHASTEAAGYFETEYRRAVVRELDELQLFGVDLPTSSRRHRLSVAYVTLAVEQRAPTAGADTIASSGVPADTSAAGQGEEPHIILSADQALAQAKRLIIRGLAGSGKTTLLQWIAVRSALQSFEHPLEGWNNTVPFFVSLRKFANNAPPSPEDFPRQVASIIVQNMPPQWVHEQLRSGRAIVLIDGVDEVPQEKREDIRVWLKHLVETFPNAYFIISSRPAALEEGWLDREAFVEAELQPMELPDIHIFIEHWHEAVREMVQEAGDRSELEGLASNLKRMVQRERPLRDLAATPLLCAMICALHRTRRHQLPSDRIELYAASCDMLLERRDKERYVDLSDYPELTLQQKRELLQDFAYWLLLNGWSTTSQEAAVECIQRHIPLMSNPPFSLNIRTVATDILRLFLERSGLLRVPVVGQVDFTHRTFQEYFAAQEAINEGHVGVLINSAHDDQWREVIILAVGLAGGAKTRSEIISGILRRGDQEPNRRHQLHLLAVACLETAVRLDPTVKSEVEKRLSQLVPPANLTEAKALATAGELAIPYLSGHKYKKAAITAACVRALALIGGDTALEALESYRNDNRVAVSTELCRAWSSFDRTEYARRILSSLEVLEMGRTQSLNDFEILTKAEGLSLLGSSGLRNLRQLAYLTNLKRLDLRGCSVLDDISAIANLIKLSYLYLTGCGQLKDISPIANLTNLIVLYLDNCGALTDLSPLTKLTNLRRLELPTALQIDDLSPLSGLTKLSQLDLVAYDNVTDLTPLEKLVKLRYLNLSVCRGLIDLGPLASMTGLADLKLRFCRNVIDLSPLRQLLRLKYLDLSGCQGVSDLQPLANLKHLRSLNLVGCPHITDLRPLMELPVLKTLSVPNNLAVPEGLASIVQKIDDTTWLNFGN